MPFRAALYGSPRVWVSGSIRCYLGVPGTWVKDACLNAPVIGRGPGER